MPGKLARSDPRPNVRITCGAGSGQHLASVLQEGRENANIDAGLGFIWRISVKQSSTSRDFRFRASYGAAPDANSRRCRRFADLPPLRSALPTRSSRFPVRRHGCLGPRSLLGRRRGVPENDRGYVPIPNRLAESFNTYSRSTHTSNFEIGSSYAPASRL